MVLGHHQLGGLLPFGPEKKKKVRRRRRRNKGLTIAEAADQVLMQGAAGGDTDKNLAMNRFGVGQESEF